MAPAVDIISYGVEWVVGFLYNNVGDLEEDFEQAINDHGADIATASVGTNVAANGFNCAWEGNYHATSELIDEIVRGALGKPVITIWAAGNERGVLRCGTLYNSIPPPAGAKNPITVGAVNTNDSSMTNFSSWGPTDDGRLKPVVVGPGCQGTGDNGITSTVPDLFIDDRNRNCAPGVVSPPPPPPNANTNDDDFCFPYDVMCGTSMATPATAGAIALILEQFWDTYDTDQNPLPSTMKALLIHTATDLGNPGPDFQFGYGLIDAQAAVDIIRNDLPQVFESELNADDEVDVYQVQVPAGETEFTVSLAWDDRPAAPLATTTLINDLDLTLEDPNGVVHEPWVLDHTAGNEANNATTGTDELNNMEQVQVDDPNLPSGLWRIIVTGEDVPEPIQKYSVVSDFPLHLANNVSVVQVVDRTGSMDHRDEATYPTYMSSAQGGVEFQSDGDHERNREGQRHFLGRRTDLPGLYIDRSRYATGPDGTQSPGYRHGGQSARDDPAD
jgi:hypothetical protein